MTWKPFLRQLLVGSGPWCLYFMQGLSTGFLTVLVPQLREANYTVSDEMVSWLPATHTYSSIPWLFALAALIICIGRKKCHIIVCFNSLMGFIIFYFSTDMTGFLVGELFHGTLFSAYLSTSVVILSEYISSKNRGVFMTFKAATYFWGVLTANAIGTFFHWQNIAILGAACGIYTLITVVFWPESPLWLASKGRFEECAASHRWLKGEDEESEKELQTLLKSNENRRFVKEKWEINIFKTICRKKFIKPILLSNLLVCLHAFSGKIVCTIYAIDILKKISSSHSTAYTGMLILDTVTVASMYLGCAVSKVLKRRVMLIGFTSVGIAFMIVISAYLYLAKLAIIDENKYISIFLLAGYSISISLGPMVLAITIIGEILPLESRSLSMVVIALTFKLVAGSFLKISPYCFRTLAMHGTFALYAVSSTITLIIIYIYLPETKDKTLQEINDCFNGKNKKMNVKKKAEEISELIKNVKIRKIVSK